MRTGSRKIINVWYSEHQKRYNTLIFLILFHVFRRLKKYQKNFHSSKYSLIQFRLFYKCCILFRSHCPSWKKAQLGILHPRESRTMFYYINCLCGMTWHTRVQAKFDISHLTQKIATKLKELKVQLETERNLSEVIMRVWITLNRFSFNKYLLPYKK